MSKRTGYRKQEIEAPFQKNGTLIALLVLLLVFLIGVAGWLISDYMHRLKVAGEIPNSGRAIAGLVAVLLLLVTDAVVLRNMTVKKRNLASSKQRAGGKQINRSRRSPAPSKKKQRITYRNK